MQIEPSKQSKWIRDKASSRAYGTPEASRRRAESFGLATVAAITDSQPYQAAHYAELAAHNALAVMEVGE